MDNPTPNPAQLASPTVEQLQQQLQQAISDRDNALVTAKVFEESFGEERRRGDGIIVDMAKLRVQLQLNQNNYQRDLKALSEDNMKLKADVAELNRAMELATAPPRPQLVHPPAPPAADSPASDPPADETSPGPGNEKPS